MDLVAGATYRARRPRRVFSWTRGECLDDRTILYVDPVSRQVQYDGPHVRPSRRPPRVSEERFKNWAGSRIDNPEEAAGDIEANPNRG